MALIVLALAYLILCFVTAFLGNRTKAGFIGVFFLSFFFTPITTLLFMLFLKEEPASKSENKATT